jgi:hypothetical protein
MPSNRPHVRDRDFDLVEVPIESLKGPSRLIGHATELIHNLTIDLLSSTAGLKVHEFHHKIHSHHTCHS